MAPPGPPLESPMLWVAYRENLSLQSVPTSPDSIPPQTMVNIQQTSTTVATARVGMVLYEHIEDSQELFL